MNAEILFEFVINVTSMGSLYALISLGLVFVFGICQLVNYAYGEYITVSGYVLYFLGVFTNLPWPVVFLLGILAGVAIGFFSELVAFRPFGNAHLMPCWVTSFAVSIILQRLFQLGISRVQKLYPYRHF